MITRRGFFGLLAGALATPAFKPLADLLPEATVFGYHPQCFDKLSELTRIYYDQRALAILKANTPFQALMQKKPIPFHGGKTIQFFTYLPKGTSNDPT